MQTEIYELIKEYIFKPLIGYICSELWHILKRRFLSYIKRYQSKRQKGVGKHAPFILYYTLFPRIKSIHNYFIIC